MTIAWKPWKRRPITLVVDDGPTDATPELVARLEGRRHRAVFFILGCNVTGREATLIDAVRRGFALGNHSFDHPYFSRIDLETARAEITATEALIETIYAEAGVPRPGRWFRFPYLDTGDVQFESLQDMLAGFGFEQPAAVSARLGVDDQARRDWPTTVNTGDWAMPEVETFRSAVQRTRPGDVVEFHDKPDGIERYVGPLIDELAALSLRGVVPEQR